MEPGDGLRLRVQSLKREILINGGPRETRVAILEDDRLVELLVDRPDQRRRGEAADRYALFEPGGRHVHCDANGLRFPQSDRRVGDADGHRLGDRP